ncbi:MAG: hypothetical protein JO311_07020 [Candidatus Eremiobacteraeota bacterium]|nr:hypothetical protein [Candidatus Eremiobacteraeota bacterium]MBV9264489.1 hypothetical protein [Candidatus Eremiobacteraeota bacterium]
MDDDFVPLWELLRPAATMPAPRVSEAEPAPPAPLSPECADAAARARRFRAALCDAVESAVTTMLPEIARDVLGRELRLAPCDLASIVRASLERHADDPVVTIRAHRDDLAQLEAARIECLGDDSLQRGDVILCLRSGTIDLQMSSRLDAVLARTAS